MTHPSPSSPTMEQQQRAPAAQHIAGRDLDAQIAERVMGARWVRVMGLRMLEDGSDPNAGWYSNATGDESEWTHGHSVRPYSTDIAAAWLVVRHLAESDAIPSRFKNLNLFAYCYNRTYATFDIEARDDYSPETWSEGNGEHATPLAICLAALKACEQFSPSEAQATAPAVGGSL